MRKENQQPEMNYRPTRRSFAVDRKMKEIGGIVKIREREDLSYPSVATDNATMKMGRTPTSRLFSKVERLYSS